MKFVLDASVSLAWFLPDEDASRRDYATRVLAAARNQIATVAVPLLWHEETADVLLRARRAKKLSAERFAKALALLGTVPVETHMNACVCEILIERAQRYHLRAYDAVYFDLAAVLALPIATLDGGIRTASRVHGVKLFDPA